jgi:4a-hydroxytetrahydrobiopterin dehydratase
MQSSKHPPARTGKPAAVPAAKAASAPSSKQTLTERELADLLRKYPEWAIEDGMLVRFWTFNGFLEAIAFVNRVARLAETAGHHPDIDIRYNRVKLALVSHDAGGMTARDAQMVVRLSTGFAVARSA